jgi:hypothetical protein
MDLHNEGIQRAKEASEILEPLGDAVEQAECLIHLAYALRSDNQFDSAGEAASRGINLLSERGEEFRLCQGHRVLGDIYQSKGMTENAIHHLDVTLRIASCTMSGFGFISPWRRCFLGRAGSTMHMLTLNAPSCARSATHTIWLARHTCRLDFGINRICLKRRNPKHRALSMHSRSSGLQGTRNTSGISSSGLTSNARGKGPGSSHAW